MATVRPFRGLRFTDAAGSTGQLVCPPYDIISEEERKSYLRENPHNIIRLELPKEGENPYETAGKVLKDWIAKEMLRRDEKEAFYIYEIEFTVNSRKMKISGLVARVQLEEFSKGIVLPHEQTLSKAKEDRLNLMKATDCNFSQIYSLYIDGGKISGLCEERKKRKPDVEATDQEGLIHRLWIVTDANFIEAVQQGFADKKLYIADGHHRYETALNYRNYMREKGLRKPGDGCDDIMMFLADMEQDGLVVLPTHRIVRDLANFDREWLLEKCGDYFEVKSGLSKKDVETALGTAYDEGKAAFALYSGSGNFDLLCSKVDAVPGEFESGSKALRGLDVSVLHTLVLERLLGIDKENMAKQINLTYTRDEQEAIGAVDSGKAQCAFILNPTRVSEIKDVALAGEKMPQKSTYFYPKLITGLVMNKID